jgi:CIC family chloride channel protein
LRPAAGGLLLGGLLLALPQMYGVGYPVLENAIGGRYVVGFLLLMLAGKIVATSLTIGIGGSGGVFAPSLFNIDTISDFTHGTDKIALNHLVYAAIGGSLASGEFRLGPVAKDANKPIVAEAQRVTRLPTPPHCMKHN